MSITFRTWVSRRFISATTHDLGQEPINFSKIVMWFIVAQSFPVSALLWPGPGQFWQLIVGKQCSRVEGRAASSVCSPGDNPFISVSSHSQRASYLRTPVPTTFRAGAVTLCCCSSVLSSSSYLLCACGLFPCPCWALGNHDINSRVDFENWVRSCIHTLHTALPTQWAQWIVVMWMSEWIQMEHAKK